MSTPTQPVAIARGWRRRAGMRLGPLPAPARRVLSSRLLEGLTTPHGVSHYLEALHPLWSLEGGRALVADVVRETPEMVTITLQPDHAWAGFAAGQHVRLGVEIDSAVHTRTYSLSCSAHRDDGRVTITVKRKDDGLVSGHLTGRVGVGDVVRCSPATGEMVLPTPRPERLVLISGGSGITPLASMLRTLAHEGHPGRVTFVHYARAHDEVPFAADLARIDRTRPGAEVVVIPTARDATGALTGRFHPDHLDALAPDHLEAPTFACGPTGLVDAVEAHYEAAGAADRLGVERFTPPTLHEAEGPTDGTVRFEASGVEVADDGRPLLEQAEDAGLAAEFGCRMGICHTCTRRKPSGAVIDLRSGRRSDATEEDIQICVSVAAGDVAVDL